MTDILKPKDSKDSTSSSTSSTLLPTINSKDTKEMKENRELKEGNESWIKKMTKKSGEYQFNDAQNGNSPGACNNNEGVDEGFDKKGEYELLLILLLLFISLLTLPFLRINV